MRKQQLPELVPDDLPYCLIVACGANRAIGKNNALPWHLPEDLQHFKQHTMGKIMLMGGKTFRSLPKVLPGRYHIVITSTEIQPHPQVLRAGSFIEAHQKAQRLSAQQQIQTAIMVIGGAQIYSAWLPLASCIEMTEIQHTFDGDAFFPQLDQQQWKRVTQPWQQSANRLLFRFTRWQRVAGLFVPPCCSCKAAKV